MSFCPSCGADVGEYAFCTRCGNAVHGQTPAYTQPPVQYIVKPVAPDAPDKGWFILGFLLPPVGLLLYLLFHGSKPQRAGSAGRGALWCFLSFLIVALILAFLTFFTFAI